MVVSAAEREVVTLAEAASLSGEYPYRVRQVARELEGAGAITLTRVGRCTLVTKGGFRRLREELARRDWPRPPAPLVAE